MTKESLIEAIAIENEISKAKAHRLIDSFVTNVQVAVQKGGINIPGLGSFRKVTRKAKNNFNPRTKTIIQIPERKVVKFRVAASLKRSL